MSYYNRDMCLTGNRDIVHVTAKYCGTEKSGFQASQITISVVLAILGDESKAQCQISECRILNVECKVAKYRMS